VNKLSPDQARKRASELLAKAILGTDPTDERKTERAATSLTFSKAVAQYLDLKKLEVRASSLAVTTLYLTNRKYFGGLHAMPLTKVTRSDVSSAVNKITVGSGAPSASRARAHLSAFYVWAIKNGHTDQNPVTNSATPKVRPSRERVLTD